MRWVVLGALILLSAACGAYSFPASQSPSPDTGTVTGRVVAVPCAPVEKAGEQCAGRPVASLTILFSNGKVSVAAVTDSNGGYTVRLAPGTWKVAMKNYMRIISGPTTIALSAGSTVVANYVLDSGIRVPAPGA
jgi:hypothetical protein